MSFSFPKAHADKLEFLIDAQAYYSRFARALELAQEKVVMVGWNVDSRTSWIDPQTGQRIKLSTHIRRCLQANPKLHIYILCWDFNPFIGKNREWWPYYRPEAWGQRVHFQKDFFHPFLSSHHQKIVLIDDQLAFVGGFDFCEGRWDTPEHRPVNRERVNTKGRHYSAFHDVQSLVQGPVVQDLVEEVTGRWLKASGNGMKSCNKLNSDLNQLFENNNSMLTDCSVQVCLTQPEFREQKPLRENLRVTIDLLKSAKKYIYIENQYFTHRRLVKVLLQVLKTRSGPEIILVLPRSSHDKFEEYTIGITQRRALNFLKKNDYWNRLRVCYPRLEASDQHRLYVHSKLLIVDDCFVKIGSTNLNHRSMGFDTECDLLIEAHGEEQRKQIHSFRNQLLSEHLETSNDVLECQEARGYSLLQMIDERSKKPRSLQEWPDGLRWFEWLLWSQEPWFDRRKPFLKFPISAFWAKNLLRRTGSASSGDF